MPETQQKSNLQVRNILITGQVQGVGFRPFVYRLAQELGLFGWVRNVTGSVEIHAEGSARQLDEFAAGLIRQAPAIARPQLARCEAAASQSHADFTILQNQQGEANIHVPPDFFTYEDCLRELNDPSDRRYRYPVINCTQCGPRYTLIESLPYDRPNTTMKDFPLCADCAREYLNPLDRRFHAEPVACAACGPRLEFIEPGAGAIEGSEAAPTSSDSSARSRRRFNGAAWSCGALRPTARISIPNRFPRCLATFPTNSASSTSSRN